MIQADNTAQRLPIIYFGSGPLAARSLNFLASHFIIEAVVTKPRPTHHKGPVPVAEYCESHEIPCLTPVTKTELSELFAQKQFDSQLGVVIDYGIIINSDVIDAFPLGIVNSHFSLLPEWRGADPITFAILSGQNTTGVSLMLINEQMDEGPLLAQTEVQITTETNIASLTDELIEVSNTLLLEILPLYAGGMIQPVSQANTITGNTQPSYSRKLTKEDGTIDWQKPAIQLEREVRAYLGWPKSRATLGSVEVIITQSHVVPAASLKPAGFIETNTAQGPLLVHTAGNCLAIDKLKPTGKNEMTAAEFVRGYGARISTS